MNNLDRVLLGKDIKWPNCYICETLTLRLDKAETAEISISLSERLTKHIRTNHPNKEG